MDQLFEREMNVELLTGYINKSLRDDRRVVNWAFYMEDKNTLVVRIDYLMNFHSRDQIMICAPYDYDVLKAQFDYYFEKHIEEWNALRKED